MTDRLLTPPSTEPLTPTTPPPTGGARSRRRDPNRPPLTLFLFPLPALAIFTAFFVMPTLQAFQYAVTDWDGYSATFANVGLDNFTRVLTGDTLFRNAAVNNAKFLLVVVAVQTVFSLVLAMVSRKFSVARSQSRRRLSATFVALSSPRL